MVSFRDFVSWLVLVWQHDSIRSVDVLTLEKLTDITCTTNRLLLLIV